MEQHEKELFAVMLERLTDITKGCRESMHEPDEQDVSARVEGGHLDNAGVGDELNVVIKKEDKEEVFNLASLIALARKANLN